MDFRQNIALYLLLSITLCLPLSAQQVEIPDPNLRAAIRSTLNPSVGVPITQADMPQLTQLDACLLYTSPSPRDRTRSRMPSSA